MEGVDLVKGWNLTVEAPVPPTPPKPDEVTPEMEGEIVLVAGRVIDVANISGNLRIGLGSLSVFVPRSTVSEMSYIPEKGDLVEIAGYVEMYRGLPEIVLFNPEAIREMEVSGPVKATVKDLDTAIEPLLLTVTWDSIGYEKPDYFITVHDSSGSATLNIDRSLLPNPFKAGTGSVLNIVVDPLSGSITSLNVSKAVPARLLKTGSVSLGMKGKTVAVNGTAVNVAVVGKNLKLSVDDGSGEVAVFVLDGANLSVRKGQVLYLAGYVDEYRGEPEIVVYTLDAVRIYEKPAGVREATVSELPGASGKVNLTVTWDSLSYENGAYYMAVHDSTGKAKLRVSRELLPDPRDAGTGSKLRLTYDADAGEVVSVTVVEAVPAEEYATGEVTLDLLGKTVIVEGSVVDIYAGSTFVKLTIDDGTGELVVFIPKSVAGNTTFEKGETIRVAGYVAEYKGTVEVIPYRSDCVEVR